MTSQITRRIGDAPSSIIVQFVSTYGVWILAERIGLSPILTIVVYAMSLAIDGRIFAGTAAQTVVRRLGDGRAYS